MAEYIDRNLIEWYGCDYEKDPDCENRECSSCSHAKGSHAQVMQIPTADVIERSEYEYLKKENRELAIKYDNGYNNALEDANHALTVLENMTETEREEWFEDYASVGEVIHECTIQRIIKSTKEYEEKKKAEEESIKVGDEVVCNCPNEQRVIITAKYDNWVTFMRKDGACYSRTAKDLKKTGRHFEEISQLLDKLRGDE